MSRQVRRQSSEYSASGSEDLQKKDEIVVSDEEKSDAKSHLYSVLFSEPLAKMAVLPSFLLGAAPVGFYLCFGYIIKGLVIAYTRKALGQDNPLGEVLKWALIMVGLAVVSGICKFLDQYLWIRIGSRLSVKIRKDLFHNMMRSEITFFDTNPIGGILTLLSEDAQLVQDAFGTTKGTQVTNIGQFLAGIILAYIYSWKMALVATATIPVIMIFIMLFMPAILRHSTLKFTYLARSMTIAQETLGAIRTVRGFNSETREVDRFTEETVQSAKHEKYIGWLITGMMTTIMTLMWGSVLGNLYFGAYLVQKGIDNGSFDFGVNDLFSVFGFTLLGCFALLQLQGSLQGEQKAIAAGARIIKLSKHESTVPFDGGRIIEDFKGHIEFKNVSFKYPTRDAYVLKNVSFVIKPGQVGALVGHSGSGKSTCVQLLERYYDVTEGMILLDGVDIRELDPRWLHRQIALVAQEPTLFQTTIRKNITYGVGDEATDEEVNTAAEDANCKKFIDRLPHGFEEMVGEKGSSLSGGQRQRVAIARAIIKKPRILITDEATSALDAGSEKKVQAALDNIMKGLTAVVVAHRLSTIRNADVIYVFESGIIEEVGTHDELVKAGGAYYNLVSRQLTDTDNKNRNAAVNEAKPEKTSSDEEQQ